MLSDFFFSSRRRHTRSLRDWSSDVCSSDLYTSNLLCIVWVGFDDYSDLRLSGTVTAAPIWAEFMKRALKIPEYSDAGEFKQIGRASCRERVEISVVAVSLKKKRRTGQRE